MSNGGREETTEIDEIGETGEDEIAGVGEEIKVGKGREVGSTMEELEETVRVAMDSLVHQTRGVDEIGIHMPIIPRFYEADCFCVRALSLLD